MLPKISKLLQELVDSYWSDDTWILGRSAYHEILIEVIVNEPATALSL